MAVEPVEEEEFFDVDKKKNWVMDDGDSGSASAGSGIQVHKLHRGGE